MKRRLHSKFVIEDFNLKLSCDKPSKRFYGDLKIIGNKVGRPSKRILLNQDNLKIVIASITHINKSGQTVHEVARINHLKKRGEVRLHTETMLYPGKYELYINYNGPIDEKLISEVFTESELTIMSSDKLNLDNKFYNKLMPHIRTEE